jgi:hypothetical protein
LSSPSSVSPPSRCNDSLPLFSIAPSLSFSLLLLSLSL